MTEARYYPVQPAHQKRPHGNTKTGLPFHQLKKGESFIIPAEDYNRTNSARAHFQKKREGVKFSSRALKDKRGVTVEYEFRRDK